MVAALQEGRQGHGSAVDAPAVDAFARQRLKIVAADAPLDALTFFGFDPAFQVRVRLTKRDEDLSEGRVVEDRHRFHDPLDARAPAAPQQPGCIAGPNDRRTERVQHGEEHLRIGTAADTGGVQVLEHNARIGRQTPQRGRNLRVRRHGRQSDQVMRPGTYGSASAGWHGRTRATRTASIPASCGTCTL